MYKLLVLLFLTCFIASQSSAQGLGWDYQEQARSHTTDLKHIDFYISFFQSSKKVIGKVISTLEALPGKEPLKKVVFDDNELSIGRVYRVGAKEVNLDFDTVT